MPEIVCRKRVAMHLMGVQGQHQGGTFLNDADTGMLVSVDASFVAFGLPEPALQIKIILRQTGIVAANKQARLETGHDFAHVLRYRIVVRLKGVAQGLKSAPTFCFGASRETERGLHLSHPVYLLVDFLLAGTHLREPAIDAAGQAFELRVPAPPFFTSRLRCKDVRTSLKASAIRKPGGCSGPP